MENFKICCTCKAKKSLAEFTKDKNKEDGLCPRCKSCKHDSQKKHRQQNKENNANYERLSINDTKKCCHCKKIKSIVEFYHNKGTKDGLERLCIECRKIRQSSPKGKERNKRYYETHKQACRKAEIKWRTANLERTKQNQKRWAKENPDKVNAITHRHRALKRTAKGTHTGKDIQLLRELQQGQCLCCKRFEPEVKLTVDHIFPIGMKGRNDLSNLQLLCSTCNSSKGMRLKDYRSKALKKRIFAQQELF